MNKLKNLFMILGILLLVYSLIGKFMGGSIWLVVGNSKPLAGLTLANSLMLLSILIKPSGK